MVPPDLLQTFVTHLPEPAGSAASSEYGETLGRMLAKARESWPGVDVPPDTFVRYLAERVPADADVNAALAALHVTDLYLACACAHRVPGAIERFESHFARTVEAFIRGVHGAAASADDIRQAVSQKLFVDEDGAGQKIERYAGRGKLSSWVGVTVQRVAINLVRRDASRAESAVDALSDAIPSGANPELDYLKARYRSEFRAAFQKSVAELSQRERVVLRHHYVNGLSQERIGRLYNVNQATVSRWILNARESIRKCAERELQSRLNANASEVQSIAALIKSQFDMSLARCLAGDGSDGGTASGVAGPRDA